MVWIRVNRELKYTRTLQLINSIDNPMLLLDDYHCDKEGYPMNCYKAISLTENPDISIVPAKEENHGESLLVNIDWRYTVEDISEIRIQCADETLVSFANSNGNYVHAIKPDLSGTTRFVFLEEEESYD